MNRLGKLMTETHYNLSWQITNFPVICEKCISKIFSVSFSLLLYRQPLHRESLRMVQGGTAAVKLKACG